MIGRTIVAGAPLRRLWTADTEPHFFRGTHPIKFASETAHFASHSPAASYDCWFELQYHSGAQSFTRNRRDAIATFDRARVSVKASTGSPWNKAMALPITSIASE